VGFLRQISELQARTDGGTKNTGVKRTFFANDAT
jgi:hypothetical protein